MNWRKIIRVLLCLMVLGILSCVASGCQGQKKQKKSDGFYLYYTNQDHTKLVEVAYEPKHPGGFEGVREVLDAMNKMPDKKNTVKAKPEHVLINDILLEDRILKIDFNQDYEEMGQVEEVLCRSAIVLTVSQVDGVDCVNFTIEEKPLCNSKNEPVGNMTGADFVDHSESNINSFTKVEVELYFGDSEGKTLVPMHYEGVCSQNTSVEKLIVEKLIKGPKNGQYTKTLPSGIRLLSIQTKDGICYVNFDDSFCTEISDVSAELELYSIVNSLAELPYINKVLISVNGNTNKKLRDEISLEFALSRNLDVVAKQD